LSYIDVDVDVDLDIDLNLQAFWQFVIKFEIVKKNGRGFNWLRKRLYGFVKKIA
jgi:hypothetical protein